MKFIAHNIRLNDGTTTIGARLLLAETPFMQAIKKAIERYAPSHQQVGTLRAVDLACHEGGFAVELARMGFDTLGIDARKENLIKANYVKFNTRLNDLNFALDDVRNLERHGQFDVVLCTGILYHLDQPAEFLKMLYRQTNHILILYSFYAPGLDPAYDMQYLYDRLKRTFKVKKKANVKDAYRRIGITLEVQQDTPAYISHYKSARLGLLTRHEGYTGRWYREWNPQSGRDKIEAKTETAYSNHRSFWFTKGELVRALYDAGFSSVEEQTAPLGDFYSKYPSSFFGSRLLVAIK